MVYFAPTALDSYAYGTRPASSDVPLELTIHLQRHMDGARALGLKRRSLTPMVIRRV